mgnify:CR=1 FL=1
MANWDEMDKIYKVTCSTRRYMGDDAVETELTLDYSNIRLDELITKAIKSDVISWQASYRNKTTATKVPTSATYVVPKPGRRPTSKVELTAEALAEKFGVDEAIKMLMALKNK